MCVDMLQLKGVETSIHVVTPVLQDHDRKYSPKAYEQKKQELEETKRIYLQEFQEDRKTFHLDAEEYRAMKAEEKDENRAKKKPRREQNWVEKVGSKMYYYSFYSERLATQKLRAEAETYLQV